ncbi:calcium-binding protein [Roseovarius aestuariivivens]|uniref:calcium-binding protein n=1 Tax=Roseovarius aestuariivivens TaxID=1888910 RepID=UPI0010811400|nr:calcium-binding protein [Roseovarius aestuariivivens]
MTALILLTLLGIGATAFAFDLFEDNDDDTGAATKGGNDDQVAGTEGEDILRPGPGDDTVRAGAGSDLVDGGSGNDRLFGEEDDDFVAGGAGDDFLRGGAGDDVLIDSDGADTLRGDTGDDFILSSGFTDQTTFIDTLAAAIDDPTATPDLFGADPEDIGFDPRSDADSEGDVVDGGRGDDTFFFGQDDTITGGEGTDFFIGGESLTAGKPAVITDLEVNEEALVLTTESVPSPDVTVENVNGDAVVSLNGLAAVILKGVGATFTLSDVKLIDVSA